VKQHGKNRDQKQRTMMPRELMIPAEAAVDLCRILGSQQIVRYGDCRQKYEQEQRQRDELGTAVTRVVRRKTQPEPGHCESQQEPGEIEKKLHSQCRFYSSDSDATDTFYLDVRLSGKDEDFDKRKAKAEYVRLRACLCRSRFDLVQVCPYDETS
jgi:hypothetical protein